MMPPLMTVGSRPPASSSVATIDVVVVLPCVPPMATACLKRMISASISARRTIGSAARAAVQFRIALLDGGRDHDDGGVVEVLGLVADEALDALVAQALDVGAVGLVGALHLVAEVVQHLGDAGHADAADADEVHGADVARHLH